MQSFVNGSLERITFFAWDECTRGANLVVQRGKIQGIIRLLAENSNIQKWLSYRESFF